MSLLPAAAYWPSAVTPLIESHFPSSSSRETARISSSRLNFNSPDSLFTYHILCTLPKYLYYPSLNQQPGNNEQTNTSEN